MASSRPDCPVMLPHNPIPAPIDSVAEVDFSAFKEFKEFKEFKDLYGRPPPCFLTSISLPPPPDNALQPVMDRKIRSFVSRTGRLLQRYNNGCRQVVGCIPYRFTETQVPSADGAVAKELEVLVISSQKGQSKMFPKGGWERDETIEDGALRETEEEAGVAGCLGVQLGRWIFLSKSQGTSREGFMFPLLVKEELDFWSEKDLRRRDWMKAADARKALQYPWMKEALDELVRRQQDGSL